MKYNLGLEVISEIEVYFTKKLRLGPVNVLCKYEGADWNTGIDTYSNGLNYENEKGFIVRTKVKTDL